MIPETRIELYTCRICRTSQPISVAGGRSPRMSVEYCEECDQKRPHTIGGKNADHWVGG